MFFYSSPTEFSVLLQGERKDHMKKGENMKRVVVYVEDKDYRQLRSELIMQGVSASEWVRNKIKEFFKQK